MQTDRRTYSSTFLCIKYNSLGEGGRRLSFVTKDRPLLPTTNLGRAAS